MQLPPVDEAVHELTQGSGFLLLEGLYPDALVAEARERTYELARSEPDRASHFHGGDAVQTQKRVWNLPDKGQVFQELCSNDRLLALMRPILGDDLMLSSYAANVLYPDAPAQEAHVDYPYWDLHAREHWPRTLNASFVLAVETVLMLDDFTIENGATAILPGSQTLAQWPDPEKFAAESVRVTGRAGSLLVFSALLWHAGQHNHSQQSRAALLGSYTLKSIKPIEDWSRTIRPETLAGASVEMRALLGADYAYPAVMDALPGTSSEGARAKS